MGLFSKTFCFNMVFCLMLGCLACGSPTADKPEVLVFAASSVTEALSEVAAKYEASHHIKVRLSFAGSSTLARQIEAGAQADVFLSANQQWITYLEQANELQPDSGVTLFGNQLALVAPKGQAFALELDRDFDLAAAFDGRIVVADPSHVPLGMYARQSLEYYGWWDTLQSRLLTTMDARSAVRAISLGKAPLGIVYLSNAQADKTLEVLAVFPNESHRPIRYSASLCQQAQPQASEFLHFLGSDEAQAIFQKFGFTNLEEATLD